MTAGIIKRTVQATTVALILVGAAYYYSKPKLDTSKDRKATVIVQLGPTDRMVHVSLFTYINEAERSSDTIDTNNPTFSETFWVRPGEKVRVWAQTFVGKASLTCTILIDGVPAAGPYTTPTTFEALCELSARA